MILKPCPCCGSEPKIVYGNDAYVKCPKCNMRGPGRYGNGSDVADYNDRDNAVMDWNALPRKSKSK